MQLVSNDRLAQNRVKLGTGLWIVSLAIFGLSWLASLQQPGTLGADPWVWTVALVIGFGCFLLGRTQIRRWGPSRRQTDALEKQIKGLDDRFRLYSFLSSSLPDYILVGPGGVQAIEARNEAGRVTCIKDKWNRGRGAFLGFFDEPLGNPTADANRDIARLKSLLEKENLADVPVSGLVVFTDPKVNLRVEGSSVPVTRLSQVRDQLRRWAGKGQSVALNSQRVREVQAVFDRRYAAAKSWR